MDSNKLECQLGEFLIEWFLTVKSPLDLPSVGLPSMVRTLPLNLRSSYLLTLVGVMWMPTADIRLGSSEDGHFKVKPF